MHIKLPVQQKSQLKHEKSALNFHYFTAKNSIEQLLLKNSQSISIKTKSKIFLDIFNSHNMIWQKNEIIFHNLNIKTVYLTRKLTAKFVHP